MGIYSPWELFYSNSVERRTLERSSNVILLLNWATSCYFMWSIKDHRANGAFRETKLYVKTDPSQPKNVILHIINVNTYLRNEMRMHSNTGADPENFSRGGPTLSKKTPITHPWILVIWLLLWINSVWRITVEVHKYEK